MGYYSAPFFEIILFIERWVPMQLLGSKTVAWAPPQAMIPDTEKSSIEICVMRLVIFTNYLSTTLSDSNPGTLKLAATVANALRRSSLFLVSDDTFQ